MAKQRKVRIPTFADGDQAMLESGGKKIAAIKILCERFKISLYDAWKLVADDRDLISTKIPPKKRKVVNRGRK